MSQRNANLDAGRPAGSARGALVYFLNRDSATGVPGVVAADGKFLPLDVQEPQLRLDLLAKLQKLEYSGDRIAIFLSRDPTASVHPSNPDSRPRLAADRLGPMLPPPPPPLQVPAEFFGYASTPARESAWLFSRVATMFLWFAEGDTFLNNYRLIHIGNDSADVEEISTGRHARRNGPAACERRWWWRR